MFPLTRPRRHRRLLLPPGLLALAWLLWLGCVALPQVRGMRVQHVMEITFPKLYFSSWEQESPLYLSPEKIAAFRPWQTATITGNLFADDFALRYAQAVMRRLSFDPYHNRGLRVFFGRQATYASLIKLLDWCKIYDIKKYWVNFRHRPYAIYVITTKPKQTDKGPPPSWNYAVGTYIESTEQIPWLDQFKFFFAPDWRNSTLLLLLLVLLSGYRLGRGWWAR